MLDNGQLHKTLAEASRRYANLKGKFAEFAAILETNFTHPSFFVKGFVVRRELEDNHLDVVFVGRTFRLVFSTTIPKQQENLVGIVSCFEVAKYPDNKLVPIGSFTFKPNGESDMKAPPDNDPLYVDWDAAAIHIGLHLVYEGLAK